MDLRSEAGSWTIHDLAEDLFGDSPTSCAEYPWAVGSDRRARESSVEALQDRRHRTPSPSIACIDPRLTVLLQSPPASPSEEGSSADGDWSPVEDRPQESTRAYATEEKTAVTLGEDAGSNGPEARPNENAAFPSGERRMTRSTETQVTTRAVSRNPKEMVKGPDKTHTKWKCRAKGDVAPSGPSTRISHAGRCPDPGPIGKGASRQAEGIEKIHMKLWKCRIGGCNKTFHRKGDAVRHVQTTARHNGKAVVCGCGAPFSRHDALKRHQRLCGGPAS
ncbi:hypothetical protein F5148DRAFT_358125 [Russula earlei]|uniref:Uncharacterized protein n=1 Tax=Russula earlei TaxID=71964 RepID=A0ACC0UI49_9AGAM|nr:hypothetical protein F5148DRAFT_358125 [Russula earlei]